MPLNHREIVLRGFQSFNAGDWEAASSNLHPDFVWVNDEETARLTGTPVEAVGPAELRRTWRAFFDLWQEWRMTPGQPVDGGDGRVLIPVHFTGLGKESGVPIEFDYFQVWEFRDGMTVRITQFRDHEAALAAAGLADQSRQP
jgi:ketosteroid isomerase-like protein